MARISFLTLVSQAIVQNMQPKSSARLFSFFFLILKWVHIKCTHPPVTRKFSPHASSSRLTQHFIVWNTSKGFGSLVKVLQENH